MTLSDTPSPAAPPPQPFLVALAAWALPGLGYIVIGDRTRGLTVGTTIIALFVVGLLIGGVRSLEVPMVEREEAQVQRLSGARTARVALTVGDEIRAKPWSIAQFFNGPVGFVGAWFSARASTVDEAAFVKAGVIRTPGVESHARVNEIAVLYTAVAGMLNLLAIIDSAHRAGRLLEER